MASDTVPAVPPPHPHAPDDSGATGLPGAPAQPAPAPAGGGWLAGTLAAVDPARPTFDLNPHAGADGQDGAAAALSTGGSSADFHNDGTTPANGSTGSGTGSGGQDKGVLRAFAHAAIERWRQGGQARLKTLDIQKERAKALQVKEARTSTVNRSEKLVGGTTGTNTTNNASKGSDTKTSAAKKDHTSGGKTNSSGAGGRSGPAGHGGGAGRGGSHHNNPQNRGTGSGGAGSKDGSGTAKQPSGKNDPKAGGGGKNGPAGSSGSGAGKPGPQGNAGKPGKDGKTPTGGTSNGTSGPAGATGSTGKDNKPPVKTFPKDTTTDRPWKKTPDTTSPKNAPGAPGATGGTGGTNTGPGKTPAPGGGTQPVDLKKNPDTKGGTKTPPKPATGTDRPDLKKTPGPAKPDPKTTPAQAPAPGGTTVNTQAAREAGYRDGSRAGKAAAHAAAYKDGVKDGWKDTKEAAARDKARLDQAHANRKQQQTPAKKQIPPKPPTPPLQTIPPKPTTPPPAPDPRTLLMKPKEQPVTTPAPLTPVQVTGGSAANLYLGDGADRPTIGRGEVRTLKQYQRLLTAKCDRMTRVADGTKALQAHAEEQAKQVTKLREQAKAVQGGEKLVAALTRLEEAALIQARKAAEIHKRAVRGAENTRVLNANTETRYGGMYRAVVNSDETVPAKMTFYKEGSTSHA